jgi:hypothetical protein
VPLNISRAFPQFIFALKNISEKQILSLSFWAKPRGPTHLAGPAASPLRPALAHLGPSATALLELHSMATAARLLLWRACHDLCVLRPYKGRGQASMRREPEPSCPSSRTLSCVAQHRRWSNAPWLSPSPIRRARRFPEQGAATRSPRTRSHSSSYGSHHRKFTRAPPVDRDGAAGRHLHRPPLFKIRPLPSVSYAGEHIIVIPLISSLRFASHPSP